METESVEPKKMDHFEKLGADLALKEIEEKVNRLFDEATETVLDKILELRVLDLLQKEFGSGYYPPPEFSKSSYGRTTFYLTIFSSSTEPARLYLRSLARNGWKRKWTGKPTTEDDYIVWSLSRELFEESIDLLFKMVLIESDAPDACRIVKTGEYITPTYTMICRDGSEKILGEGVEK